MRPGPNQKRGRGRGNGRKPSSRSQSVDSNGPSVRIRGNAYQVLEKYLALARDATTAGDRVSAENYYQHAEHYFRIVNANAQNDSPNNGQKRQQPAGPGHREQPYAADPQDRPQPAAAVEAGDRQSKTNGSSQPEGGNSSNGSGPSDGADGADGADGPDGSDTDNSQVPV